MKKKKILESIAQEGLDRNGRRYYIGLHRVKVRVLSTKILRGNISQDSSFIEASAPPSAEGYFFERLEKGQSGETYYTVSYCKITKRF